MQSASPEPANDEADSTEEEKPPLSPFEVSESEQERFEKALKRFHCEPSGESGAPAAGPHTPPKKPVVQKRNSSSPTPISSKRPDPLKPIPPKAPSIAPVSQPPIDQNSKANSSSDDDGTPIAASNEAMTEVNGFLISVGANEDREKLQGRLQGLLSSDLGEEEEGYTKAEDAGPAETVNTDAKEAAVPAVAQASPAEKSTLEHLFDEFLSTEKTFEEKMTDYSVKLELMKKLLTDAEYTILTKGLGTLLVTSAQLIKSFEQHGPFATYTNDALVDEYYDALTTLTINTSSAIAILRQVIEDNSCKETYGDLWDMPVLACQRGPRHRLLVQSAIKEDASFKPLETKLADKVQKINNSILLGQYNSLASAIAQIVRSKKLIFKVWENLSSFSYIVTKKGKSQTSDIMGIEIDEPVPVIEHTLDFLIRIAKALNDPKSNIGLEAITKDQINVLFTTLQKNKWYTTAESGKKIGHFKLTPNNISRKAQELKIILRTK